MASVTFSYEEWGEHQAKLVAAHNEVAELRKQLDDRLTKELESAGASSVDRLRTLVESALTITTFAAANLPPETTPNWPAEALTLVADNLDALPSFTGDKASLRIELHRLASEAATHNRLRRERKLKAEQPGDPVDDAINMGPNP